MEADGSLAPGGPVAGIIEDGAEGAGGGFLLPVAEGGLQREVTEGGLAEQGVDLLSVAVGSNPGVGFRSVKFRIVEGRIPVAAVAAAGQEELAPPRRSACRS